MSTVVSKIRSKVPARWSVGTPAGTRALDPALMSGLPAAGAIVWVDPPLVARAPSWRLFPNARLLPLVPDRVNPVLLPTALKFTLTVLPVAPVRMSGPLALVFPETIEFSTVTTPPAVVVVRAMPPPPWPAAFPLAVFPTMVLPGPRVVPVPPVTATAPPDTVAVLPETVVLRRVTDPELREIAPPVVAAVFPEMVLFCTRSVPAAAKLCRAMPPPATADVLLAIVLLRITRVLGVNPAGGEALGVPKK